MILLLGGTREANELAKRLYAKNIPFVTTVVSAYGAEIASENSPEVLEGILDEAGLHDLVERKGITKIIDMTHPYAEQISILAHNVSEQLNIDYYRYQRPESFRGQRVGAVDMDLVVMADSYEEAAIKAVGLAKDYGGNVFLTIGSKRAVEFYEAGRSQGVRVVCRVLPDPDVLNQLKIAGISHEDIVALLGPFTHEFNKAMFLEYQAAVVVTKDAGVVGGTDTKITACMQLGIPIVIIKRPATIGGKVFTEIDELLRRVNE